MQLWILVAVAIVATVGFAAASAGAKEPVGAAPASADPTAPAAGAGLVEETLGGTAGPVTEAVTPPSTETAVEAPPEDEEPEAEEAPVHEPAQDPSTGSSSTAGPRVQATSESTAPVPAPKKEVATKNVTAPPVEREESQPSSPDVGNSAGDETPEPVSRTDPTSAPQAEESTEDADPMASQGAAKAAAHEPDAGKDASFGAPSASPNRGQGSSPPSSAGPGSGHSGAGSEASFRISDLTPGRGVLGTLAFLIVLVVGVLTVTAVVRRELGMGILPRLPRSVRHRLRSHGKRTSVGPAQR